MHVPCHTPSRTRPPLPALGPLHPLIASQGQIGCCTWIFAGICYIFLLALPPVLLYVPLGELFGQLTLGIVPCRPMRRECLMGPCPPP